MTLQEAFDLAVRKARYGHKDWIVWTDGKEGFAELCTAEAVKSGLDSLATQDRFWRISATSAQGQIVRQRAGEIMLRNCLRGQDGPRMAA
jgi:hypothetical protein